MAKTIVGSFDTFTEARDVIDELHRSGFAADDISLIANNVAGEGSASDGTATVSEATSGAATGAAAGGLLGGAAGLVVGLMGLALPGIGPIVAAGPLAATLAGAGVGAVAGGLIGGLTSAGVPETEAEAYAEAVRRGGALVTVRADDSRAEEAAAILRNAGAVDIDRRAEAWRGEGWQRYDPSAGEWTAEQVQRERERARAARGSMSATSRSADELSTASAATMMAPSIDTPSDPEWNEHREHFRLAHAEEGGGGYEEFEPAYRYGWSLGRDTRWRGRDWNDIERDVRSDYESRHPGGSWDRARTAVRRGWERTTEALERALPGDSDRDGR